MGIEGIRPDIDGRVVEVEATEVDNKKGQVVGLGRNRMKLRNWKNNGRQPLMRKLLDKQL
jgi:hypothetical protein